MPPIAHQPAIATSATLVAALTALSTLQAATDLPTSTYRTAPTATHRRRMDALWHARQRHAPRGVVDAWRGWHLAASYRQHLALLL